MAVEDRTRAESLREGRLYQLPDFLGVKSRDLYGGYVVKNPRCDETVSCHWNKKLALKEAINNKKQTLAPVFANKQRLINIQLLKLSGDQAPLNPEFTKGDL